MNIFGQTAYLNRFTGRKIAREISGIYFIDHWKLIHVVEKNRRLYNIRIVQPGSTQHLTDVLHYLGCLLPDIAHQQLAGSGINGDGTRNEKHIASTYGLAVWANWRRSLRSINDSFHHGRIRVVVVFLKFMLQDNGVAIPPNQASLLLFCSNVA